MHYILDRHGRVICRGANLVAVEALAARIAAAGAGVSVASDEGCLPIGRALAWEAENPSGLHVDPADVARVAGMPE